MWPALRTLLSAVQHRCLRPCAIRAATRAPTSEVPHKSHLRPRSAASPCPLALSQQGLPGRAGERRWAPGRAGSGVCTAAPLSRGSPAQSPGSPAAPAATGRARRDTRGRSPLLAAAPPSPRPPLAGPAVTLYQKNLPLNVPTGKCISIQENYINLNVKINKEIHV
ncbi:MAPK-interacting and spindle-stabilizing protein-like [Vidua macroura]|uniref:MAPK-interacting and spindle-stabilizing protein-like n=1 Tax=Vidua macroura TaxID=187451 RepID=UPI0023A8F5B4|nr:MAPK-interacting and spindle-stabilizing protein-like [Vidua macroura]